MKHAHLLVLEVDTPSREAMVAALSGVDSLEIDAPLQVPAELNTAVDEHDLAIVGLSGDDSPGLAVIAALRAASADLPLVAMVRNPTVAVVTACFRLGVNDCLVPPFDGNALRQSIERLLGQRRRGAEYELLRRQVERPYGFDDMIGGSPAMRRVFETIQQVAESDVDVLVLGETGTGKELVARSIHNRSRRSAGPFVPVDCGAIPESLLESEFFGHERGAFTGADQRRIGLLEFADRGTFFLDELAELPLLLQAKLLRTLQERRIRRVGGREEIDVNLRIVAATARPLDELMRNQQFRQDLYYRIHVVRIELPPLRDRGDDVGLIAEYMANRYSREMSKDVRGITPEAYQVLAQYDWPGNVRELQNVIRRGIALTRSAMLGLDDLADEIVVRAGRRDAAPRGYFQARDQHLARFERQYLTELLSRHRGDVRAAAKEACLPRGTLYRLLKNHGLESGKFRS